MEGFERNSCLAPGFRFYPTEEELLTFYLRNKLEGIRQDLDLVMHRVVPVLDIYEYNPWELPQLSGDLCNGDHEQWFFFIPRQESEAHGGRPRRVTTIGYWKGTGSPAYVYSSNNRVIGVKRSMVFYVGRAPQGKKTEWKMNDYKAIQWEASSSDAGSCPKLRHEFSLCRVYKNSRNLRLFDRRPMGVDRIERARDQPVTDHRDDATTDPSRVDPGRPSPQETLSSGDNDQVGHSSQSWERSDTMIGVADEGLWDWEQLENWYICGEDM